MELNELFRQLDLETYVAFDFETTGLDFDRDKIIEVAAVRFKDGEIIDSYATLVNPKMPIPTFITNITNISDEMVSEAPTEDAVINDLVEFIGNDPLVAHNIDFDYKFLKSLKERYLEEKDADILNTLYDTLVLAQTFLYFLPNHRLGTIAEYFNIPAKGAHRALADTENVGFIFNQLINEACSYSLSTIQKLIATIKDFKVPNKELFVNIANLLVKSQNLNRGLTESTISKPVLNNVFRYEGKCDSFPESANDLFGEDGLLASKSDNNNFELRNAQIKYSDFVLESMENGVVGIAEAGTGLGKSLAYIYPALKTAIEGEEGPSVISCHTKHLQNQLFYQELPKLAEVLDVSFSAVMMKGRQNYLCKTRLNWLIGDAKSLLSQYEVLSLLPVIVWLQWTKTGDFSECNGFTNRRVGRVRSLICSEIGFCSGQVCKKYGGCFVGPLRINCQSADVIVINHALLLAELKSPGILPEFSRVVIDEAHNIVKVGYSHYQRTVDHRIIWDILSSVNPSSKSSKRIKGQIEAVGQLHPEISKLFSDFQTTIETLLVSSKELFTIIARQLSDKFSPKVFYLQKKRYKKFKVQFADVNPQIIQLIEIIRSGINQLETLLQEFDRLGNEKVPQDLVVAVKLISDSMEDILNTIRDTTTEEKDDSVYWYSGSYKNDELYVSLNMVPVDIGKNLLTDLFTSMSSVIITSATLKTGREFGYLISRMGLSETDEVEIRTREFQSPFHYDEQCNYYQYGGSLSPNDEQFPGFICDLVTHLSLKWKKRILVLFTARRMVEMCYSEFEKRGLTRKYNLFPQLPNFSRNSLLAGFKNSSDGILFGTNSFWEGIDLPKELLEVLIITKLPFDVPNDPTIQAYGELVESAGKNKFMEFNIPEAVIKLRQGFGRLIRSSWDEGVFINLDNRVAKKRYGSVFSEAIPVRMITFSSIEEI